MFELVHSLQQAIGSNTLVSMVAGLQPKIDRYGTLTGNVSNWPEMVVFSSLWSFLSVSHRYAYACQFWGETRNYE